MLQVGKLDSADVLYHARWLIRWTFFFAKNLRQATPIGQFGYMLDVLALDGFYLLIFYIFIIITRCAENQKVPTWQFIKFNFLGLAAT